MSIWSSEPSSSGKDELEAEAELTAHRDEYGEDEAHTLDVATAGIGLIRIASFGVDGVHPQGYGHLAGLPRVVQTALYVPAAQVAELRARLERAERRELS